MNATRVKSGEKDYSKNDIVLVSEYVCLKEMYLGDTLTVKISYPSGRFEAYTSSIERDRYYQKH